MGGKVIYKIKAHLGIEDNPPFFCLKAYLIENPRVEWSKLK